MDTMYTTTEAADYLNRRGDFPRLVTNKSVLQWCKRGKFANAVKPATRRGEWRIPENDLQSFPVPRPGRSKRN